MKSRHSAVYLVWTPIPRLAAVKRQTGPERMYPPARASQIASTRLNLARLLFHVKKMNVFGYLMYVLLGGSLKLYFLTTSLAVLQQSYIQSYQSKCLKRI